MNHRIGRSGSWLYDGSVVTSVHLVETDYDFSYELTKADGMLDPEERSELNSDGRPYYVCFGEVPAAPDLGGLRRLGDKAPALFAALAKGRVAQAA